MDHGRFCVYELRDPRNPSLIYVGMTNCRARRFRSHLAGKTLSTRAWIEELRALGLKPKMVAVQKGLTEEEAYRKEVSHRRERQRAGAEIQRPPRKPLEPMSDAAPVDPIERAWLSAQPGNIRSTFGYAVSLFGNGIALALEFCERLAEMPGFPKERVEACAARIREAAAEIDGLLRERGK